MKLISKFATNLFILTLFFGVSGGAISAASPFTDVSENYRAYDSIKWLVDIDAISGFEDGSFRPHENLSRAQTAIIIGKAIEADLGKSSNHQFSDVSDGVTGYEYINRLLTKESQVTNEMVQA